MGELLFLITPRESSATLIFVLSEHGDAANTPFSINELTLFDSNDSDHGMHAPTVTFCHFICLLLARHVQVLFGHF